MIRSPQEVQAQVRGLLAFVHTPFDAAGEIDLPRLREHLRYLAEAGDDKPSSYTICRF
jgi:dihydrodipicolinate synthase/N-acetylneuraminate lyase